MHSNFPNQTNKKSEHGPWRGRTGSAIALTLLLLGFTDFLGVQITRKCKINGETLTLTVLNFCLNWPDFLAQPL